jgi:polar amino acid transport system permease protein
VQQILDQFFDPDIFLNGDYIDQVLKGFWYTVKLAVIAGIFSLIWGLVLAVLRQTPGKWGRLIRWPTIAYIDVFRGIPALIVILVVSTSLAALSAPNIETGADALLPRSIGVPNWLGQPSTLWYGVIALTITYGAYMAEVYRAGIEAVPNGQMEAARSLGMSHGQSMRKVIVPQAVRKVIPPLLNDFIALMKDTTLASFIGLIEVVQAGNDIASETFSSTGLMMGAFLFVIVTVPMARIVDVLISRQQQKFQRGLA